MIDCIKAPSHFIFTETLDLKPGIQGTLSEQHKLYGVINGRY